MPRRVVRILLTIVGELVLIGAALLAVSMLLALPQEVTWQYPWGIPVPHLPPDSFWPAVGKLWAPLLQGGLGISKGRSVAHAIQAPAEHSLLLLLAGFLLAVLLGVLKGIWDFRSLRRGRFSLLPGLTALMQGLPDYWLILLCQWGVGWLLTKGLHLPLLVGYEPAHPIQSLFLPLLIIALVPAGAIAHITGEALIDTATTDAVRTARSKGLAEVIVLWRHTLRLAMVEVLDALPAVLSMMLTNLVVVEYLTYYPGLGRLLVEALHISRDPYLVRPIDNPTAFASALILLATFFIALEFLHAVRRRVDPRLREEVRR